MGFNLYTIAVEPSAGPARDRVMNAQGKLADFLHRSELKSGVGRLKLLFKEAQIKLVCTDHVAERIKEAVQAGSLPGISGVSKDIMPANVRVAGLPYPGRA